MPLEPRPIAKNTQSYKHVMFYITSELKKHHYFSFNNSRVLFLGVRERIELDFSDVEDFNFGLQISGNQDLDIKVSDFLKETAHSSFATFKPLELKECTVNLRYANDEDRPDCGRLCVYIQIVKKRNKKTHPQK